MNFSEGRLSSPWIGRFAPSPTGPLHFGSLLAALASYLEVGTGAWLVRIEDVDRPRSVPDMARHQLQTLSAYGFEWFEPGVVYQSSRSLRYEAALQRLIASGMAYPCTCTRSRLAQQPETRLGVDGAQIYPGHCSDWQPGEPVPEGAAWRFRVGTEAQPSVVFHDKIQGKQQQQLARDVGDFVIKRADGCYTYQLAVVVDDLAQGVTQIVRGADLLDSTARQIALIRALGGSVPAYAHIPVATNEHQEKLSKQTRATSLPLSDERARVVTLLAALDFLGQHPPKALEAATQREVWAWARAAWSLARVPVKRCLPSPIWADT